MKPEIQSNLLLGVTRSKAKMYEYDVPLDYHIGIYKKDHPSNLFSLAIGLLGDLAERIIYEKPDKNQINELNNNLQFSARFFDAYIQSKLDETLSPYFYLIGSAAFYLCDHPGNSSVLIKELNCFLDIGCGGLENLLAWILKGDFDAFDKIKDGLYSQYIKNIMNSSHMYFSEGVEKEKLFNNLEALRKKTYNNSTPRQLLLADVIFAIIKKRSENSIWNCLPKYTGLELNHWLKVIKKKTFLKEFWPAQHLLGNDGIFSGKSAVIQMPTSAGKTRAIEIIIRSAFISGRTSLALIVAPFRALCHEIKNHFSETFENEPVNVNELSDVFQLDFEIIKSTNKKNIIVVTPEKLIYVLRHTPELASKIGLLIFDEGHQFDNGIRGVTYELLITSLKSMVPDHIQKLLISAVISNAKDISKWLIGENSKVITGNNIKTTNRTIGFASWTDKLGRLEFVIPEDIGTRDFYVPRIIEEYPLRLRRQERNPRMFPNKNDGKSIALFLGLKIVHNGSVAIFCGKKQSVTVLCDKIVEAFTRGLPLNKPCDLSDKNEVESLYNLYKCNMGNESNSTQSAKIGIFSHHNNIPHGIRLAVEYAMKESLVKFVICTSTLAQGVNLPIRYLIVSDVYQGKEQIKTRDFHNLIGRAGRSGMHTEGSILFTDHNIYDKRNTVNESWRWDNAKSLLQPNNSEPCASSLLSLFKPFENDDNSQKLIMGNLDFVNLYINNETEINNIPEKIFSALGPKGFSIKGIQSQINWKKSIIYSIESFLMSHWDITNGLNYEEGIIKIAKDTLAYHLATEKQKEDIAELFKMIANKISEKVTDPIKRKVYGKTLFGINSSQIIDNWVKNNINIISSCKNYSEYLIKLWPLISDHVNNNTFKKIKNQEFLETLALGWIEGKSFFELFKIMNHANVQLMWGSRSRKLIIENIIDICENGLSYDGSSVIGAIIEFVELLNTDENIVLINNLKILQKMMKYGLSCESTIEIYELGINDRYLCQQVAELINFKSSKIEIIEEIKAKKEKLINFFIKYPLYYKKIIMKIIE
ncbi:MAG: hypothetical protein ACD_59C00110G0004 [uncultured bacterium]|nr:MAG: hypothetical protein ACD_59C00110G0004 [uncultured bacterium]